MKREDIQNHITIARELDSLRQRLCKEITAKEGTFALHASVIRWLVEAVQETMEVIGDWPKTPAHLTDIANFVSRASSEYSQLTRV